MKYCIFLLLIWIFLISRQKICVDKSRIREKTFKQLGEIFLITLLCFLCGEKYWLETAAPRIIHLLRIHTHILSMQSFVQ